MRPTALLVLWYRVRDSNPQPMDYESTAQPSSSPCIAICHSPSSSFPWYHLRSYSFIQSSMGIVTFHPLLFFRWNTHASSSSSLSETA